MQKKLYFDSKEDIAVLDNVPDSSQGVKTEGLLEIDEDRLGMTEMMRHIFEMIWKHLSLLL